MKNLRFEALVKNSANLKRLTGLSLSEFCAIAAKAKGNLGKED